MLSKSAGIVAGAFLLSLSGILAANESPIRGETELAGLIQEQDGGEQDKQDEKQDDKTAKLEKQVQLQQKQIENQQKQIETLQEVVKQLQKTVAPGAIEEIQTKTTQLESRSVQAARRDQDLARAIDDLTEKLDNEQRNGPCLPANVKQLFLPSRTNETPLSVYGLLVGNYTDIGNKPPNFDVEFAPFFLLTLNEQFYLEAELEFGPEGVELGQGQLDWILNDWATLVLGRFLTPLGFFNERIHPAWINKLPDNPLVFRQVTPTDFSQNGIQLRGGKYLGCSPVKLEYSLYVSNGIGVATKDPELTQIANLGEMKEAAENINNALAFGGRLGFWVPDYGLTFGASVFFNGSYSGSAGNDLTIWQLDAGRRWGNWEVRSEYAQMHQEAKSFIGENIERRGLYAQVGYRPYDACSQCLQKTEFLFRYSFANFDGIDPGELELGEFATTIDLPVDRNQYAIGIDYWLYPSLVLKFAYEINQETGSAHFHDNAFMAQMAWGW